jgi:LysM repeat protein
VRAQPLAVCRFLASETADGGLGPAIAAVAEANRCTAVGDRAPQSARQQELVCLVAAHVNCPRFLRGTLAGPAPAATPARQPLSRAVVGSALLLVAAIAASFGFLAVRGGMTVALASPSPLSSQIAVLPRASVVAATGPASAPPATLGPSLQPSPSSSPVAAESPVPSATPAPTPTPAPPTPRPTPRPTSDRYALLEPCPSTPNCWIYTVRAGDNLVSIAHWFGVPLDTVYAWNPWARTTGLRAGQQLRLPPPTR